MHWQQDWAHKTFGVEISVLKIKRSWRHEERCTSIFFGKTVVMAVYARDSDKDLEQYEACVSCVLRVLREGRRRGAKQFYISGDLNVELG